MRNKNGDGIICCYCGRHVNKDFIYYSFDFYRVDVHKAMKSILKDLTLSADVCETCMDAYNERVKQAYKPPVLGQFNCDVSGESVVANEFSYYRCMIAKVEVSLSNIPYTCSQCKKNVKPDDGPCADCKPDVVISRAANILTNDRYLELNFSASMYEKFASHVELIKKLGVEEWAT